MGTDDDEADDDDDLAVFDGDAFFFLGVPLVLADAAAAATGVAFFESLCSLLIVVFDGDGLAALDDLEVEIADDGVDVFLLSSATPLQDEQ